jgi:pimeloyl-ACP methyl ester carboxylesterase
MKRSRRSRRRFISPNTWTILLLSLIIIALLVLVILSVINRQGTPVSMPVETSPATDTPQPTPTRRPTSAPITPTPVISIPDLPPDIYSASFVKSDCRFSLPQAAKVTCGIVTVPVDRQIPQGSTIRLAVAIYHSTSRTPAQDPLIYLHSTPGGSHSVGSALQWTAINFDNFVLPILETRDLVVFDMRGSGLSVPNLDCPEAITVYRQDQLGMLTVIQRRAAYTQALSTCRDRLIRHGIDPAHYTTQASAADAREIILALGLEKVNLFSIAYSTRLAQTILRDYPELVRSVVFESPIPLDVNFYKDASARYDQALMALFESCAADSTCSTNYPDLETIFENLVSTLDESPLAITLPGDPGSPDLERSVDGSVFTHTLISAMNASFYSSSLPKLIYDLNQGERASSMEFIKAALSLPSLGMLDLSAGMRFAADCQEQIYATTPEELMESQASHPYTQTMGEQAILGDGETLFALCDLWGAASFDPQDIKPLVSEVPALVISRQVDPITPPSYAQQLSEALTNSYYYKVPNAGHAPSLDQHLTCPFNMAQDFLAQPDQSPDSTCLDQFEITFYTPYTGEQPLELLQVQIPEMELQGLIPVGWTNLGEGIFSRDATFGDDTRIEIRSSTLPAEDWLSAMIADFDGIGFDRTPARTNTRYVNGINWSIYRAFSNDRPVDLALAETDDRTLLVLLLSQPDERDPLYRTVFLLGIDGTKP